VAGYSNPRLTGPDCCAPAQDWRRRKHGAAQRKAAAQERAVQIRPLQTHRHAQGSTAGGSGGTGPSVVAAGLAWRGSRREEESGGKREREVKD
jgi:hypothetical protein